MNAQGDVKANGHATAVSAEEEDDDIAAGPELPAEEDVELNDEDGRFFGGGVTSNTASALNYVDKREEEEDVVGSSVRLIGFNG